MADTCPRDVAGYCLLALVGACPMNDANQCCHDGKTRREKLAIRERHRQKLLKTASQEVSR